MRSQTFPLEIFKGHLLIEVQGHTCLIDTGATFSIMPKRPVELMGRANWGLNPKPADITAERIADLLGKPVDALFGADLFKSTVLDVDVPSGELRFLVEAPAMPEKPEQIEIFMGIPLIRAEVAEKSVKALLDTGAWLSYALEDMFEGYSAEGIKVDFHPTIGEFMTQSFPVPAIVGGQRLQINAGILPKKLLGMLELAEAGAVIGWDLFEKHRVVIDYPGKRMWVSQG